MKQHEKGIFVAALMTVILVMASPALAAVVNTRPTVVGSGLQSFFDGHVSGATYDAFNDQSAAAIFKATGPAQMTSFVFSGSAAYQASDLFGIYSFSTGSLLPIFQMNMVGASAFPTAVVFFDTFGNAGVLGFPGTGVLSGTGTGFGEGFGFFTKVNGEIRYTEDSRNSGQAFALEFNGHGGSLDLPGFQPNVSFSSNYWLTAFETSNNATGGLKDFTDFIVVSESITPVPEPGTMLLLGSGLIGLASWGRKKFRK